MALTKVTGGTISTTSDYTINNLVGVAGTFTGNLNVEGVLTYEDVTNIDAVGLITARKGIHLGAGATVGHLSTVGVSTITSLTVNGVLTAGHRIDMTQGYQLGWKDGSTNRARIHGDSGNNFIVETGSSNTERLRIDSSGRVLIGTTTEGYVSADNLTVADAANAGITIRSGTGNLLSLIHI